MPKQKIVYECEHCGTRYARWQGKCDACGAWESIMEMRTHAATRTSKTSPPHQLKSLSESAQQTFQRINSGLEEFDRVIGGGFVPGSLVLMGGQPGIGKSTLLLQICGLLAAANKSVLYFSGEESLHQVADRANRLGAAEQNLHFANEQVVENIQAAIEKHKPAAVVVDSIQTTYSERSDNLPGSITQVRESADILMRAAKSAHTVIILVGHITKDGYLAGPKMLEHVVDTVLYLEGDRQNQFRMLRAVKNRFGSTHELGVFEMVTRGLTPVVNPSELFLSNRVQNVSGTAITSHLEGSRSFLVEVQALVSSAVYGNPQRNVTGYDLRRLSMLLAVLDRRLGFGMGTQDVFVNVVGGLKLEETAVDLGILMAVLSSLKDIPINPQTVIIGEVGLGGEVRAVSHLRQRLMEARKLDFKTVVCPKANQKDLANLKGIDIVAVRTVSEALESLF
ncbi:MAG: DNA repair protein RadA [Candidatus Marinimicrobia bacterium]|nr:DNA repair protein RadA [Candidatus Neomarinimicrobiota bacterium]MCF7839432.1 DNA repair protein RadA [Candidatus Neomarinimicrobiota bacterium]MCF7902910.1 DNA repair protein RadA [Candidatus Neomarinimicrobiota bacterium]